MEDAKIKAICFPDKHFQTLPPLQNVLHFPEGFQEPLELAVLRCLLQSCRSTNEAQKLFFSIWLHVFNDFSFPSPKPGAVPHNSWECSGGESSKKEQLGSSRLHPCCPKIWDDRDHLSSLMNGSQMEGKKKSFKCLKMEQLCANWKAS